MAKLVLCIARIEFNDSFNCVVSLHIEGEGFLQDKESEAFSARGSGKRASVLEQGLGLDGVDKLRKSERSGLRSGARCCNLVNVLNNCRQKFSRRPVLGQLERDSKNSDCIIWRG